MSDKVSAPWYFWVVAIVLVLFNAVGVFDFTMTQLKAEFYMGSFSDEQKTYFYSFPLWMVILWGASVLAAFIGSIALLLRSALSVKLYLAGLVGYVLSSVHNMVINPMPGAGMAGYIAGGVIFVVLAFALWFAWAMSKKQVVT